MPPQLRLVNRDSARFQQRVQRPAEVVLRRQPNPQGDVVHEVDDGCPVRVAHPLHPQHPSLLFEFQVRRHGFRSFDDGDLDDARPRHHAQPMDFFGETQESGKFHVYFGLRHIGALAGNPRNQAFVHQFLEGATRSGAAHREPALHLFLRGQKVARAKAALPNLLL